MAGEIELPSHLPITRELEEKRRRLTKASHVGDAVSVRERMAAELLQSVVRAHQEKRKNPAAQERQRRRQLDQLRREQEEVSAVVWQLVAWRVLVRLSVGQVVAS